MRNNRRSVVDVAIGPVGAVVTIAVEFILGDGVESGECSLLSHVQDIVVIADNVIEPLEGTGIDIGIREVNIC